MFARIVLIILVVMNLVAPLNAQESTDLISVVDQVRNNHPQLKRSRARVNAAKAQWQVSRAAYRPTLNLQAFAGKSERKGEFDGGNAFDENISPQSVSLELNQLLYDGGQRAYRMYISALGVRAEQERLYETENRILQTTVEAYLNLELAKRSAKLRQKAVENFEQQLKNAIIRKNAGEAAKPEVAQIAARLAEVRSELITADLAIETATLNLEILLGYRVSNIKPAPIFARPEKNLDDMLQAVIDENPGLTALKHDHFAAKLSVDLARRQGAPTFSLTGRASNAEEISATLDRDEEYSLGIQFAMPLYSGGRGKAARLEARALERDAYFAYKNAAQELKLQVLRNWTARSSGEAVLVASQKRLTYENEALEGLEASRAAGAVSTTELLLALENSLNAEVNLLEAEINLKRISATLALFLGFDTLN